MYDLPMELAVYHDRSGKTCHTDFGRKTVHITQREELKDLRVFAEFSDPTDEVAAQSYAQRLIYDVLHGHSTTYDWEYDFDLDY